MQAVLCGGCAAERYERVINEHESVGCRCTEDSEAGRMARAGQFWKDGRDTREDVPDEV